VDFWEKWPTISSKLHRILDKDYCNQKFPAMWPDDINDFFIILKLLPIKNNRKPFLETIEKFIVFKKVYLVLHKCITS
jgi:hypothetical protein